MKLSLNTQIFMGAALGVVLGVILGHTALLPLPWQSFALSILGFLGKFFIEILKLILVPLVFASITAGIGNLKNYPQSGRIWPILLLYSLTTTALASVTGLTAMNILKPGTGLDLQTLKQGLSSSNFHPVSIGTFLRHLFEHVLLHPVSALEESNILTVVIMAIAAGVAIIMAGTKGQKVLAVVNQFFEVMMRVVRGIMYLAPLGIMGLLAILVSGQKAELFYVLSKYILLVVGITLFHGLITLPAILWLTSRISPFKFFQALKGALITAFSTSSSTATLPVSLRCLTQNLKIESNIARFVLPIGAALNMDGTAMYEAMAALFVANLCGVHLGLGAQVTVALTAMMASVGAPGIPSAGMVTMIMVLQSVGLPAEAVGLLIAIDRPLDTIRTVVNVEGDCVGACVVQRFTGSFPAAHDKYRQNE